MTSSSINKYYLWPEIYYFYLSSVILYRALSQVVVFDFFVVFRCPRGVLCVVVSGSIYSQFLLANLYLCLPCHPTSGWDSAGISDQKGQASKLKGFQIRSLHRLYLEHIDCSHGSRHFCPEELHQYWHWDTCIWNIHIDNSFSCPNICPKGESE